jgi:hypothetical protein
VKTKYLDVCARFLISEDPTTNKLNLTKQSEIVLAVVQLIKADISFDGDSGPGVTDIGVIAWYNSKALSFWLP